MQDFEHEHPLQPVPRPHADRPDPLVGSGWLDLRRAAEAELSRLAACKSDPEARLAGALPRPELR